MKNVKKKVALYMVVFMALLFLPAVRGQAAGSGKYRASDTANVSTKYYSVADDLEGGGLAGSFIVTRKGKTVASDVSYVSNILYSEKDFYYFGLKSLNRMDYSGKNRKIKSLTLYNPKLICLYKQCVYYTDDNGRNVKLYKINLKSGKRSIVSALESYIESFTVSGKYLFFRCAGEGRLNRLNLANGKSAAVVKSGLSGVWGSDGDVFISTTNYKESQGNSLNKVKSSLKKYSTKTNKFKTKQTISKGLILYGNDAVTVYKKKAEGFKYVYLYLKKIKKTIKVKTDDFRGEPVIKGNYCYYITYDSDKFTSSLWRASLKTGKTSKRKTVKNMTLSFSGSKASYLNSKYTYSFVTLK